MSNKNCEMKYHLIEELIDKEISQKKKERIKIGINYFLGMERFPWWFVTKGIQTESDP